MQEIWKDVVGYEGIYQVSNLGLVKGLDRYDSFGKFIKGKQISIKKNNRGYCQIHLCKNGKCRMFLLHRVVAEAFIDNPNKFPQVNHKDENKDNNCVDNLEWCTNKYNRNYGTGYFRSVHNRNHIEIGKKMSKAIIQYDQNWNKVNEYYGVKEAERKTGINESNIRTSMRKKYKAGGYWWKYA